MSTHAKPGGGQKKGGSARKRSGQSGSRHSKGSRGSNRVGGTLTSTKSKGGSSRKSNNGGSSRKSNNGARSASTGGSSRKGSRPFKNVDENGQEMTPEATIRTLIKFGPVVEQSVARSAGAAGSGTGAGSDKKSGSAKTGDGAQTSAPAGKGGSMRRKVNAMASAISGSFRRKPAEPPAPHYKIVIIGYEGGNSALVDRFLTNEFEAKKRDPAAVDRKLIRKCLIDDELAVVELFDVSADESVADRREEWFKWAEAVILVYSTTSKASFDALTPVVSSMTKLIKKPIPVMLVGTRADDTDNRQVPVTEGQRLASANRHLFAEVSAKSGAGVEEAFYNVVKQITNKERKLVKEFFTPDVEKDAMQVSNPTGFKKGGAAQHTNGEFVWSWEDFVFEEILGEGSFSKVYLARWRDGGFKVAIKVMTSSEKFNEGDIKNEYEVLRLLTIPQVVRFYGLCFKKKEVWLLMEYCDVGSLYCLMRVFNTTLTEPQIAFVCREMALAFVYLHEAKSIIHRDVKAANIMMAGDGSAKLADFGLSRAFKREQSETHSCWGTAHWMAPETMVMENYSFKADIWSLGITAYEMAIGLPPHPELQLYHLNKKYRTDGPPKLPNGKNYSQEFKDFLAACLVVNPTERASAKELLTMPFLANAPDKSAMAPLCNKMIKVREKERAKWEKERAKRK